MPRGESTLPRVCGEVYTYTGSRSKTIVFGVITTDGRGYFERYPSFTKEEFVKFLRTVHAKFGKVLIILDGAAQHRAKCVKEELKKLVGPGAEVSARRAARI